MHKAGVTRPVRSRRVAFRAVPDGQGGKEELKLALSEIGWGWEALAQREEQLGRALGVVIATAADSDGPFQRLSAQQRFAWEFYGGMLPIYSLQVLASVSLAHPGHVTHVGRRLNPDNPVFTLAEDCAARLLDSLADDGRAVRACLQELIDQMLPEADGLLAQVIQQEHGHMTYAKRVAAFD